MNQVMNILTCDGIVMCADCSMRSTPDCDKYQDELSAAGRGDDYGPNFWDALPVIERILGETQNRRSRPNAVYFLEADGLCWQGK